MIISDLAIKLKAREKKMLQKGGKLELKGRDQRWMIEIQELKRKEKQRLKVTHKVRLRLKRIACQIVSRVKMTLLPIFQFWQFYLYSNSVSSKTLKINMLNWKLHVNIIKMVKVNLFYFAENYLDWQKFVRTDKILYGVSPNVWHNKTNFKNSAALMWGCWKY